MRKSALRPISLAEETQFASAVMTGSLLDDWQPLGCTENGNHRRSQNLERVEGTQLDIQHETLRKLEDMGRDRGI
jgi:hypothetical protein